MIGFLAKRCRGKDIAADYVVSKYGYTKIAFAKFIKLAVQNIFGFTDEQLYCECQKQEIDKNWGVSPRFVLQKFGTEICRTILPKVLGIDIGDDLWIKRSELWLQQTGNKLVVWSDVRFQNEVDYILSKGGIVIKLERHQSEKDDLDEHSSEKDIDNITNYTSLIINDGSIDDLYKNIDNLIKEKID